MEQFQTIGVVARLEHPEVVDSLKRLVAFLRADGRKVLAESKTAELLGNPDIEIISRRSI